MANLREPGIGRRGDKSEICCRCRSTENLRALSAMTGDNDGSGRAALNVPASGPAHYERNFIRQAVCELRFPTLYELEAPKPPASFALALRKRDSNIADYSIALSIAGGAAALYQHYLQMGGTSVLPCPASSSEAVDCAVRFVFEFGYITFPMMALTLFAFLIVLMLFVRKRA